MCEYVVMVDGQFLEFDTWSGDCLLWTDVRNATRTYSESHAWAMVCDSKHMWPERDWSVAEVCADE